VSVGEGVSVGVDEGAAVAVGSSEAVGVGVSVRDEVPIHPSRRERVADTDRCGRRCLDVSFVDESNYVVGAPSRAIRR